MKKFKIVLGALLLPLSLLSQVKQEQELRIKREQFPLNALELLEDYMEDARRIRFYLEVENGEKGYEAKFKKGKLLYSVEFFENGELEDVEFIIGTRDMPNDSWEAIREHLEAEYPGYRIIKIQQQHLALEGEDPKKTMHQAFQNLILPYINYEIVFSAKVDGAFQTHEATYGLEGNLIEIRKYLPPNYDHVLYP